MLFESGQSEMPSSFRLPPLEPDPVTFFTRFLEETCVGAEIRNLGEHRAFDPAGNECDRTMFAVIRSR